MTDDGFTLSPERWQLVVDHLPLAKGMARKYGARYRCSIDPDERLSLCRWSLVLAARDWNPGKSAFSTYCHLRCLGLLKNAARHRRPDSVPPESEAMLRIPSRGPDTFAMVDNAEECVPIYEAISRLKEREQYILRETIVNERSQRDVAEELGVHQSRIYQINRDAMARIRKELWWPRATG